MLASQLPLGVPDSPGDSSSGLLCCIASVAAFRGEGAAARELAMSLPSPPPRQAAAAAQQQPVGVGSAAKRKKWTEEEERSLIDKYAEMLREGTLARMKTREKKFRPIAAHVNASHHALDPVSFPFQWSWKDASTKVQNMRHQYLLVKQKLLSSCATVSAKAAAAAPPPPPAQALEKPAVPAGPKSTVLTPYAKKLAKQYKVDVASIVGTGPYGRVTPSDVEAAAGIVPKVAASSPPPASPAVAATAAAAAPAPKPAPPAAPAPPIPGATVIPFTTMQAAVSKNMVESLSVPTFRVGYPVKTDALDSLYEKVSLSSIFLTFELTSYPTTEQILPGNRRKT